MVDLPDEDEVYFSEPIDCDGVVGYQFMSREEKLAEQAKLKKELEKKRKILRDKRKKKNKHLRLMKKRYKNK